MDLGDLTAELSLRDVEEWQADPVACMCTGTCRYKTGKRLCPCRSGGNVCTASCRCGKKKTCSNRMESSSSSDSSDDEDVGERRAKSRRKSSRPTVPVIEASQDQQKEDIKQFLATLDKEQMERIIVTLLDRFPEVYMDAVAMSQPEPAVPIPHLHTDVAAPWCICTKCRLMPSEVENVCCRIRPCVTSTQNFSDGVTNGTVLVAAMQASRDNFPRNIPRSNDSYRHYAYKQFTYIHHGRLGAGNRRVVPSCVVLRVRRGYPAPNNVYKGFIDGIHD